MILGGVQASAGGDADKLRSFIAAACQGAMRGALSFIRLSIRLTSPQNVRLLQNVSSTSVGSERRDPDVLAASPLRSRETGTARRSARCWDGHGFGKPQAEAARLCKPTTTRAVQRRSSPLIGLLADRVSPAAVNARQLRLYRRFTPRRRLRPRKGGLSAARCRDQPRTARQSCARPAFQESPEPS
jgi:hypothetical protein